MCEKCAGPMRRSQSPSTGILSRFCVVEQASDVRFEPLVGGAVTELSRRGARMPWGTITEWSPPEAFAMRWFPGLAESEATMLRVCFRSIQGGTEVLVHHSGWETCGEAAAEKRDQDDGGWPVVLARHEGCAPRRQAACVLQDRSKRPTRPTTSWAAQSNARSKSPVRRWAPCGAAPPRGVGRTPPACDHPRVNGPSTHRRAACPRCLRPLATCLCALARPTAHRTEVLVLQHPQEQRQAKNSVALLRLSLAQCEVCVGERFAPEALQALLQRPGRLTCLLYPEVPAAPAPPAPAAHAAGAPLRLVVIDATWRKSLRMLLEHPALAALPRLALDSPAPTRYRAIRAARRADQLSTLEATVQALAVLEGPAFDAAPLLDAFGHFVEGVAVRQGRSARVRTHSGL
jgi:DTW domain-containing protein YfiP